MHLVRFQPGRIELRPAGRAPPDLIGKLSQRLHAWTGTRWPDLIVAAIVAGLFLHSSWSIVREARRDLNEAGGT